MFDLTVDVQIWCKRFLRPLSARLFFKDTAQNCCAVNVSISSGVVIIILYPYVYNSHGLKTRN